MSDNYLFIDKNLPEPLENNELISCFMKMKEGSMEARDKIIVHNIKLVLYYVSKKFKSSKYDKRELASIGLIGLIKAVDTYDINMTNTNFFKYALTCIRNEILRFIVKNNKHFQVQSLSASIGNEADDDLTIENTLSDKNVDLVIDYERKETIEIIRKLIANLNEREKEIIMLYFGFYNDKRYTQQEIAKKFNISHSRVSMLIQKTLQELSVKLEQQEIIVKKVQTSKKVKSK